MSDTFLNLIKNEKRKNLGKRFKRWIDGQWDYEKSNKWEVSEERALKEITESILLNPKNKYFTYKNNKLIASTYYISFVSLLEIDTLVFKELLRDSKLKEILD